MDVQAVAALVVGTIVVLAIPALALSPQVGDLIRSLRGRNRG
jgi:hypothetical protein